MIRKLTILATCALVAFARVQAQGPMPQEPPPQEAPTPQTRPGRVTFELKNTPVADVLRTLSEKGDLNIVAAKEVQGNITVFLRDVKVLEALDIICEANGLAYTRDGNNIVVTTDEKYRARYGVGFNDNTEVAAIHLVNQQAARFAKELNVLKSPTGSVVIDPQHNTVIVVDAPDVVAKITAVLQEMDQPDYFEAVRLRFLSPEASLKIARAAMVESGRVETDPKGKLVFIYGAEEMVKRASRAIKDADIPPVREIREIKLNYITNSDVTDKFSSGTGESAKPPGNIYSVEETNTIIISDVPAEIEHMEKIIAAMDQKPLEVMIEARILQVALDDRLKIGINWESVYEEFSDLDPLSVKGTFDILTDTDPGLFVTAGLLSEQNYQAAIELLQSYGATNLISNPRITTINGVEAKIQVVSTVPYKTVDTREEQGTLRTFEKVTTVDAGVKLFVTPHVSREGYVIMEIKPEVSSVTGYADNIPVVEKSETETKVLVKDGVTVIIGGLIKKEIRNTEKRVPLLGAIPLLGYFFRSTDHQTIRNELVIFITPHIITGDVADTTVSPVMQKMIDDNADYRRRFMLNRQAREGSSQTAAFPRHREVVSDSVGHLLLCGLRTFARDPEPYGLRSISPGRPGE